MAARYKKRFKNEEVLKLLLNDASDDDSFSELDDDRESDVDFEPPDVPSDVESDDTGRTVCRLCGPLGARRIQFVIQFHFRFRLTFRCIGKHF